MFMGVPGRSASADDRRFSWPRRRASQGFVGGVRRAEGSPDNRAMFAPIQDDVRRFFVETQRKRAERLPLTPLETIAADWIDEHPEYAADLADADARAGRDLRGRGRPREPVPAPVDAPVDQRAGRRSTSRAASARRVELLAAPPRLGARGAARGDGVPGRDALGVAAQRPCRPTARRYVDCVRRRATR